MGITAGPDGNLWFTEFDGNRIGRITPAGVVTEFSAGISAGAYPYGITAGPDGNLWFTEYYSNRIGRITPAGAVTEFSAGISADTVRVNITAGPDGNLWFTATSYYDLQGNRFITEDRIGRITTSGVVTEFSAGISAGASPFGIAAGPDGNLWFTEENGHRIGRITPAGVVTEFSAGISARAMPLGIAAGPDGNLWFTEWWGNRIGRITPGTAGNNTPTDTTIVLQPGPGEGKDIWTTSVYSYAPAGGGPGGGLNDDRLKVGGWGDYYYSLLQFDLTTLPQHATSAVLYLYSFSSGASPTSMYFDRITQPWSWTDRLWWANRPSTTQWGATLPAPGVNTWYAIDITDLYNAWQSGAVPNYGVQLRPTATNNNFNYFYSSDYLTDPTLRPKLLVR